MFHPRGRWREALIALLVGTLLGVVPFTAPARAATTVGVTGHGFGHGRGLGQWGAFGYAVDLGWTDAQILDHFYGGTSALTRTSPIDRVLLRARSGTDTIVFLQQGALTTSVDGSLPLPPGPSPRRSVLIHREGNGWHVWDGQACTGTWVDRGTVSDPEVIVNPAVNGSENLADMLQLCEETGTRYLRGQIIAGYFATSLDTARQRTLNVIDLESYLRSVVPSESPSGWGTAGAGKGMNALRAQAVAARSYASTPDGRWGSADICDDTFCQVYRGRGFNSGSGFTSYEASTTDTAVQNTAGVVRAFSNGSIARTEFSSSTGGWTAGGAFPAVEDLGDATTSNPNHNWTTQLSTSSIESAFDNVAGRDLGALISVQVTGRNGLGEDGGRVTQVGGSFANGNATMTGEQFRSAFGLRSNWFSFTAALPPPDQKTQPAGGYVLSADGVLTPFGNAGPVSGPGNLSGLARAVDVAGPTGTTGYVLDGWGALHPVGGAPPVSNYSFFQQGWDIARDVVVLPSGTSGYVLDGFGALYAFGNAPPPTALSYYKAADLARRVVLCGDGHGGYVLTSDGGVHEWGGAATVSSPSLPSGVTAVGISLRSDCRSGYVTGTDGALYQFGGAPPLNSTTNGVVSSQERRDGSGYVVDGTGNVVGFGGAAGVSGGASSSVRDIALIPEPAGYVVDWWGGLHPFGGAPSATATAYWPGWDIARRVVVLPSGTGGFVLDGWGGLHPFSIGTNPMPSVPQGGAYWAGWDIARDVALTGSGSAGYVLDGWGGLHPFGGAPDARITGYWPNWDIARKIAMSPDGTGGFVLDGWGGMHPFAVGNNAMPATPTGGSYWQGWDIARGADYTRADGGFVLDGWGGVRPFGNTTGSGSWYGGASFPLAVASAGDVGTGWYVYLDSYGGLHSAPASAPLVLPTAYWLGQSIARDVGLLPR